jgi:hypothetical protein
LLCQATFLRGSTASELPDNPELRAQLEALAPEELEMRCRRSGLSRCGTAADQVHGLLHRFAETRFHRAADA